MEASYEYENTRRFLLSTEINENVSTRHGMKSLKWPQAIAMQTLSDENLFHSFFSVRLFHVETLNLIFIICQGNENKKFLVKSKISFRISRVLILSQTQHLPGQKLIYEFDEPQEVSSPALALPSTNLRVNKF